MHSESEVTSMIFGLLQSTSIYDDSYSNMVTQPFQPDYYGDLTPCVRIRDTAYEIVMYERGVQMLRQNNEGRRRCDLLGLRRYDSYDLLCETTE